MAHVKLFEEFTKPTAADIALEGKVKSAYLQKIKSIKLETSKKLDLLAKDCETKLGREALVTFNQLCSDRYTDKK